MLDLMRLLPPQLPRVAGIASLQTFGERTITLDLGANHLWIESAASQRERTAMMPELQVRAQRELSGAGLDLFVLVRGRNGPLWFLVDSANLAGVIVAPHAAEELTTGEQLAHLHRGEQAELDLPIGGLGAARVIAREREIIYDGVLDASFLERVVLTVDLARVRAWARWR